MAEETKLTFSQRKRMKRKNNGDNINQKIDLEKLSKEFISFYYKSINTNPQELVNSKIIREYSDLKFDNNKYRGENFFNIIIKLFKSGIKFNPTKLEFLESGSRRVEIVILGIATDGTINKNFCQTFVISNNDTWFLKNSMLILI